MPKLFELAVLPVKVLRVLDLMEMPWSLLFEAVLLLRLLLEPELREMP